MHRTLILLALLGVALGGAACDIISTGLRGSGTRKTETRTTGAVHEVDFDGPGTLVLTQGNPAALRVTAEDNLLPLLTTTVDGGRLTIRLTPGSYSSVTPTQPITYALTLPGVDTLVVTGSGVIVVPQLAVDTLQATAGNSGKLSLNDLTAGTVNLELSGSSTAQASGRATQQIATLSDSATYDGSALVSETARTGIGNSARATVQVTGTLYATVSGSGLLRFRGSPQVEQHLSGAGQIQPLGGP